MAKESGSDESAEELREEIARSRELVARNLSGLRYELDFPRKIRRSFQTQTVLWLGAAAAAGLLFTVLPRRKKKVYVDPKSGRKSTGRLLEAGFVLGVLKIAANVLKPVIVSFLRKKVSAFASASRRSGKVTWF
ncbi:MAG TPA: hypothetical protein VNY07_00015 [Chthoniobacterales bacterium]|nr:hypothetical protein [Chthoniobacterales bacterium]